MHLRRQWLLVKVGFVLLLAAMLSSYANPRADFISPPRSADMAERIRRVEHGVPPIHVGPHVSDLTINKLMEMYCVPGLNVAVIDNFRVVWAKGYGVAEAHGKMPVTTRTLFMAGSIAKTPATVSGYWNAYDSLGEFYSNVGERALAIENYERSILCLFFGRKKYGGT